MFMIQRLYSYGWDVGAFVDGEPELFATRAAAQACIRIARENLLAAGMDPGEWRVVPV